MAGRQRYEKPFFRHHPDAERGEVLAETFAVACEQSNKNFEVIVVDGKSKDKTVEVAKKFEKKLQSLRVIIAEKASLPYQRNLGAKNAKSEWFVFVDADTVLLPHCLKQSKTFINKEKPDLFTSWFCADSESQGDAVSALLGNIITEVYLMLHKPCMPGPFAVVSKKAYDFVGGYDEEHAHHEDFDFSIRVFRAGFRVRILHETNFIISYRRIRKDGMIRVLGTYMRTTLHLFLFNKTVKSMPGYIMGGHLYNKNRSMEITSQKSTNFYCHTNPQ